MKILSQMLQQFQTRHRRLPSRIVVDPEAAVLLGARRSLAAFWNGVPVTCRKVDPKAKPDGPPRSLLVFVEKTGGKQSLRSMDGA